MIAPRHVASPLKRSASEKMNRIAKIEELDSINTDYAEQPLDFDYDVELDRVNALIEPLEEMIGTKLNGCDGEDASFFMQFSNYSNRSPDQRHTWIVFSSFSNLFRVAVRPEGESKSDELQAMIVEFLCDSGYVFVPDSLVSGSDQASQERQHRLFDYI